MLVPPWLAALSVASLWQSLAGAAIGALLALLGAAAVWDRILLRGGGAPRFIEIEDAGQGWVILAGGARLRTRAEGSFVSRWLVILPVDSFWRGSVMVMPGMLPARELRLLRLWALWGRIELGAARVGMRPAE